MQKIINNITIELERFQKDLKVLLIDYSNIGEDVNSRNSSFIFLSTSGNRHWNKLSTEGNLYRNQLFIKFSKLKELLNYLFELLPNELREKYYENITTIEENIQQNNLTWAKNSNEAFVFCVKAITEIAQILLVYPSNSENDFILVADTSALISNPELEKWKFEGIDKFTILLPITVLQELDSYEMSNKNEIVKNKARSIIKRIKEYARRGVLSDSVSIVNQKINLKTIPFEVSIPKIFSNLKNSNNNDDKIFSAFLHSIRENIKNFVVLVTKDTSLFVKANHFGLDVIEPPLIENPNE